MSAWSRITNALATLVVVLVIAHGELADKNVDVAYHGLIREDAREGDQVELDNALYVRRRNKMMGPEICGYTLYKSYSELPFKVVLKDRTDGTAKIVLAPGYTLNYERRHLYSFDIAAHDCSTGLHSDREKVYIEVEDVNEYAPKWKDEMYIAEVQEGRIFDQILQVEAEDEDGSSDLSRICHYRILTPNVPFSISTHGYLKNTQPLDYSLRHNYILEVEAEDCGGKLSEKIMVNIAVQESCKVGWKGVPEETEFTPGSGTALIAEQASLEFCDKACPNPTVLAAVSLSSKQQQELCDKDTYSIQAQRRMCGASPETVDLLPNPTLGYWSQSKKDIQNTDQTFSFDGISNAIEVQDSKFNGHVGNMFTVTTWMKHEGSEADQRHEGTKEHVLCYSDGEYHNRHHYSVFVHNCHLVLLLRKEPSDEVDLNEFSPAEWRWSLPQTCDGQWHHYVLSVEFPEIHLYVDGHPAVENKDSPIIVDDWPLHPSKKISSMKLVVGACWHGGDKQMSQHFHGQLAGLTMLKDQTEAEHVIQCLSDCQEKLDFHDMADLETGMSVSLNSEMSQITFKGHNKSYIERLIRHIGYKNSRVYPAPGSRTFTLTTDVVCTDDATVDIPDVIATVMVAQPKKPTMRLSGSDKAAYSESAIARGIPVLADLTISSNINKPDKMTPDDMQSTLEDPSTLRYQLDSCVIRADPALDLNKEHVTYPRNMVTSLGLEVSANDEGLIIAGADIVKHYQQVLRAIRYVHSTPEMLNTRVFIVSCTELNGRFVSNDYEVELDVIHKEHIPMNPLPAHHQESVVYQPLNDIHIKDVQEQSKSAKSLSVGTAAGTGIGMIVIIVVCVGFLMFMIVLGVIRIRSAQQRREVTVDDRPEMEWDNSALTITVNPMEQENAYDEEAAMGGRGADSDSDDDDISVSHDEIDSSEDEAVVKEVKDRDLEWDDSTLTF